VNGALVGMGLLAALAVFIVWDSRKLRRDAVKPLSREQMRAGVEPGRAHAWKALAGLAAVFAVIGVSAMIEPRLPPFTGRGAWLWSAAHQYFGSWGDAFVWWSGAVLLAAAAWANFRGRRA
jgi:hypothetical protein